MSLIDELRGSQYSGLTDQQCLNALNATVTISTDSTAYTWSGIGIKLLELGVSASIVMNARTLVQNISPGGAMLDGCLSSGGFDFSSSENRALINGAGVTAPPDAVTLLNAMLQIGIQTGHLWQTCCASQPSLSDVTSARSQITTEADQNRILNAWTVVSNAMASGSLTWAEAVILWGQQ